MCLIKKLLFRLLLHPFMGEVLFCTGFLAWKFSVPWFLVGTTIFCMRNCMSFSNDFSYFSLTMSFICMNFVFINDKFADRWFESNIFVAKKIFLKQQSLHSDEFICDVTGQWESNIIKDVGSARLLGWSFGFEGRRCQAEF